jgi:hypothetical protein
MWARRAIEDIIASGSGTEGQMARGGFAICGGHVKVPRYLSRYLPKNLSIRYLSR